MNKAALKAVLRKNKWFAGLPPSLAEGAAALAFGARSKRRRFADLFGDG